MSLDEACREFQRNICCLNKAGEGRIHRSGDALLFSVLLWEHIIKFADSMSDVFFHKRAIIFASFLVPMTAWSVATAMNPFFLKATCWSALSRGILGKICEGEINEHLIVIKGVNLIQWLCVLKARNIFWSGQRKSKNYLGAQIIGSKVSCWNMWFLKVRKSDIMFIVLQSIYSVHALYLDQITIT